MSEARVTAAGPKRSRTASSAASSPAPGTASSSPWLRSWPPSPPNRRPRRACPGGPDRRAARPTRRTRRGGRSLRALVIACAEACPGCRLGCFASGRPGSGRRRLRSGRVRGRRLRSGRRRIRRWHLRWRRVGRSLRALQVDVRPCDRRRVVVVHQRNHERRGPEPQGDHDEYAHPAEATPRAAVFGFGRLPLGICLLLLPERSRAQYARRRRVFASLTQDLTEHTLDRHDVDVGEDVEVDGFGIRVVAKARVRGLQSARDRWPLIRSHAASVPYVIPHLLSAIRAPQSCQLRCSFGHVAARPERSVSTLSQTKDQKTGATLDVRSRVGDHQVGRSSPRREPERGLEPLTCRLQGATGEHGRAPAMAPISPGPAPRSSDHPSSAPWAPSAIWIASTTSSARRSSRID